MRNSKDDSFSISCPHCKTTLQWSHMPVMRSTVFYKCPNCGTLLNGDTINAQLGRSLSQSAFSVWAIVGLITIIASVVVALIAGLIYYFVGHGLNTIITVSILVVLGIAVGFYAFLNN